MSTEAVRQFWEQVRQNAFLHAQVVAIQEKERQTTLAALIKLAEDSGYAFTVEEYQAAIKEELTRHYRAGELSDREMDAAAGGLSLLWTAQYKCSADCGGGVGGPTAGLGCVALVSHNCSQPGR